MAAEDRNKRKGTPEPESEVVTISEFRANGRPLTVDYLGAIIRFVYKPGALDTDHWDEMKKSENLDSAHYAVAYCERILAAIPSITNDDGSPLEMTADNLRQLPTPMLNRMINAITADLAPKATPESASNGSS